MVRFFKNVSDPIPRQKAIDHFIADFYCHDAKLIIEIDGAQHFTPEGKHRDNLRTEVLEKYGLKVIRFTNSDIRDNFDSVCNFIDSIIKEQIQK